MENHKDYNNLPKEKFVLVNENKKLHDKELVTKPVGFFKDAMYRFSRNKGSIVAAIVIGVLVLFAIIAPIISPYSVAYNDVNYAYVLPKLFNSENIDFLDGAKNMDTNFVTFVENYGKGVETGHNAIKRQEYTYNEETDKYHYRLDTYQNVGVVFMSSVPREKYYAIQEYQDQSGIQIIYPITEVAKRPKNQKNTRNANIWYETAPDPNSTNDIPVNYYYDENGKLVLNNIYQKFSVPVMNSTTAKANSIRVKLENKDGGYAMKYIVKAGASYGGNQITSDMAIGYLSTYAEGDINAPSLVTGLEGASKFEYDSTYHTFKVLINGHTDSALDGYYFFGLPAIQGSTADLVSTDKLGDASVIPFSFYEGETIVDTFDTNKEYIFTANRTEDIRDDFFISQFMNGKYGVKKSGASKITFQSSGTGYKLLMTINKSKGYIQATVNGNDNVLSNIPESESANAVVWEFEPATGRLKTNLSGHTDASLDKDYYLAFNREQGVAFLCDESQLTGNVMPLLVVKSNSLDVVDTIEADVEYRFYNCHYFTKDNFYYVDGNFKGDNYFSKMRVEGEGNYLYDYAIQKDGDQFEIRVNYYEYYRYYHQHVLKDRITEPWHIFGATKTGSDIFTCLASGARFSFILAIVVASVNLIVGAIYGAIEGYYGGKVDMIMERIVEILSAVPFMIVITLLKYRLGDKLPAAVLLFIAFFLTGWIGMSGVVRMQFYRFKNQEYVLAARTLGAKDPRIMFKHIFPNALGTIVTSCVLVIPGMIFSETSLSYLGIINLSTGNMTSVGTLLADAQGYIDTYPHMILYPAIFISLLMLSFNLFGNGLRDAFNPSLRGTED